MIEIMYKEIWSVSLTSRTGVLACGPGRSAIPIWKGVNKTFLTPKGVQLQLSIVRVADWTISIEAKLVRVGWTIFSVHVLKCVVYSSPLDFSDRAPEQRAAKVRHLGQNTLVVLCPV